MRVKATREGLIGKTTASGYVIDGIVPYVALPASKALFHFVVLSNPLTRLKMAAIVLDVGPWHTEDEEYVFGKSRPLAEKEVYMVPPHTNGAGIDLSEPVWKALGMEDNTDVDWFFLDELI